MLICCVGSSLSKAFAILSASQFTRAMQALTEICIFSESIRFFFHSVTLIVKMLDQQLRPMHC